MVLLIGYLMIHVFTKKQNKKRTLPGDWYSYLLNHKVCSNEEQWQCFPEQFKDSKHKADKALYKYLTNDLIPLVIRDLEASRVAREQKKIRIQQEKEAYEEMLKVEAEYAKKLQEEENERIAREMERKELARGVATRSKKNQGSTVVKTAAEVTSF